MKKTGEIETEERILSFEKAETNHKAIPIKCFVSHRPPSREGGSVGRGKKKSERMRGSECQ